MRSCLGKELTADYERKIEEFYVRKIWYGSTEPVYSDCCYGFFNFGSLCQKKYPAAAGAVFTGRVLFQDVFQKLQCQIQLESEVSGIERKGYRKV